MSRRSNPQIPFIVFYNRRNGKETEMRKSVKMVKICVPFSHLLYERVRHSLGETMAVCVRNYGSFW